MKLVPYLLGAVLGSTLLAGCSIAKPIDEHCSDPTYKQYKLAICEDIKREPTTGDAYTS